MGLAMPGTCKVVDKHQCMPETVMRMPAQVTHSQIRQADVASTAGQLMR